MCNLRNMNRTEREKRGRLMKTKIQKKKNSVPSVSTKERKNDIGYIAALYREREAAYGGKVDRSGRRKSVWCGDTITELSSRWLNCPVW